MHLFTPAPAFLLAQAALASREQVVETRDATLALAALGGVQPVLFHESDSSRMRGSMQMEDRIPSRSPSSVFFPWSILVGEPFPQKKAPRTEWLNLVLDLLMVLAYAQ